MAALWAGLWVRPAPARVHLEAAQACLDRGSAARVGVGQEPALCFLAGASLSLASLACKMGTTTHPPGSCGQPRLSAGHSLQTVCVGINAHD